MLVLCDFLIEPILIFFFFLLFLLIEILIPDNKCWCGNFKT